jgi:hypothetical protein
VQEPVELKGAVTVASSDASGGAPGPFDIAAVRVESSPQDPADAIHVTGAFTVRAKET